MLRSVLLVLGAGMVLAAVAQGQRPALSSHQGPAIRKGTVPFSSDENRDSPPPVQAPAPPGAAKAGEYWLGIMCISPDPALRAQLNLPDRQGLLVVRVLPDSPAAKAGIARNDILLRLGERKLGDPRDLVEAVAAAKTAAVKIDLIRSGKRLTIEATPAKRPAEIGPIPGQSPPAPGDNDWAIIQRWLEGMKQGQEGTAGRPPLRFNFIHPGAIVPKGALVQEPMPENMSVTITKKGSHPAHISVERGKDKWDLSEKDLDKLPADVRPFVERMLGHNMIWMGGMNALDFVPDASQPSRMHAAPSSDLDPRIEQRFNEMNRRMDRLFKMMEQMMADRPEPSPQSGKPQR